MPCHYLAKFIAFNFFSKIVVPSSNDNYIHKTNGAVSLIICLYRYTFDITKCMFSSGNITEKLRVSSFDCRGEVVVDLYAGNI